MNKIKTNLIKIYPFREIHLIQMKNFQIMFKDILKMFDLRIRIRILNKNRNWKIMSRKLIIQFKTNKYIKIINRE